MKRLTALMIVLLSVIGGLIVATATSSHAVIRLLRPLAQPHVAASTATTWNCRTGAFFQTLNGQLSTSSTLTHWRKIGHQVDLLNALAYSPFTKYLYAINASRGAQHDDLIQIDRLGVEVDLGPVAGLAGLRWKAGDIDPSTGIYYVTVGAGPLMAINVATRVATPLAVPTRVTMGYDLIVQRGWVWTASLKAIDGFSLSTLATKEFLIAPRLQEDAVGSLWSDAAGDGLYLRWNARGRIYHVTGLSSPSVTFAPVGVVPTHSQVNDGATCSAPVAPSVDNAPGLTVSGNASSAFAPGKSRRVDLSFTNSYASAVTVWPRVIKIALSTNNVACPAVPNFRVDHGVPVSVTIPGSSTMTLSQLGIPWRDWPVITMVDTPSNQDACQGATLTMQYLVRYYG